MADKRELVVVYGGQWGSEGKGAVVAKIVRERNGPEQGTFFAVRVGGPNAGHTLVAENGDVVKVQSIPGPKFVSDYSLPVIGAGGIIIPELLLQEARWIETNLGRRPLIYLDEMVSIITPEMMESESDLKKTIGSTGEGVGAATAAKVWRSGVIARDWIKTEAAAELIPYVLVVDTAEIINRRQASVIVEGTQGFALSLNVGGFYPFCTSRDCTPEALMSQVGITPRSFTDVRIIAVVRTFPIRVGGNSGPMGNELTWAEMAEITGGYVSRPETTTVTKKQRRIAHWNDGYVRRMIAITNPTEIALTFLDYKFPDLAGATSVSELAPAFGYLSAQQKMLGAPITYVGTGPGINDLVRIPEGTF